MSMSGARIKGNHGTLYFTLCRPPARKRKVLGIITNIADTADPGSTADYEGSQGTTATT